MAGTWHPVAIASRGCPPGPRSSPMGLGRGGDWHGGCRVGGVTLVRHAPAPNPALLQLPCEPQLVFGSAANRR